MDWCKDEDPLVQGHFSCNNSVQILDEEAPYTVWSSIALLAFLGTIIVATAIGNMLVCLSVWLVRKLRRPSNFLLVSLAVSDLCVSLLVMPIALHYELVGDWRLGNTICDMWVAFDVTCCTASILNLCMISVDRYLAITKPLTYGVRRRYRQTWVCIGATWIMSGLISIPPLLILGNEHGTPSRPTCDVSQNFGYQLYATLGAFYIPLLVMVVMYCKIYVAAKRVVESDKRGRLNGRRRKFSVAWEQRADNLEVFIRMKSPTLVSDQCPLRPLPNSDTSAKKNCVCTTDFYKVSNKAVTTLQPSAKVKKKPLSRSSVIKDRKASITLGIIVTAFIVCWLPFFVVALLRSLLNDLFVPHTIRSCVLWLGYTNSMLNPIIYVTFHQDFRRSFKEMLCLRCTTVNETFREEAYRSQYGDPCGVVSPCEDCNNGPLTPPSKDFVYFTVTDNKSTFSRSKNGGECY